MVLVASAVVRVSVCRIHRPWRADAAVDREQCLEFLWFGGGCLGCEAWCRVQVDDGAPWTTGAMTLSGRG